MKRILFLLLLLISIQSFGQPGRKPGFVEYQTRNQVIGTWNNKYGNIPLGDTTSTSVLGLGQVVRDTLLNKNFQVTSLTGRRWEEIAGSGGGDSSIFTTYHYLDSVLNTLNVIVSNAGTGQNILFDRGDTVYGKRLVGDGVMSVTTSTDSSIHISANLSAYPNRTELQDTANAIRADMGTGSGLAYGGQYGVPGYDMGVDTTRNRMWYRNRHNGTTLYWLPITDSTDVTTYDVDAQTYFDAVNATDVTLNSTQKTAVNNYILGLKSDGIWSLVYDQGLPIWGTASSSAVMLKGTHTTTWVNSPTFGSTGVTGNGTSSYGNLNFAGSTAFSSQDNAHLAVYVQDNQIGANVDIGAFTTTGIRIISKNNSATSAYLNSTSSFAVNVPSSAGFTLINRTSSSNVDTYKNGSLVASAASTSAAVPTINIFLLASNQAGSPGVYSSRTISLWSIGATLTSTQATNLSTRINTLMTALGINVY